jgi:hypothetical protein
MGAPKSRECTAGPGSYGEDRTSQVPPRTKRTWLHYATYQCRAGHETPRHMALYCRYETESRHYLHIGKYQIYAQMIGTSEGGGHFVRWMMYSGRLRQFALAKRLLFGSE